MLHVVQGQQRGGITDVAVMQVGGIQQHRDHAGMPVMGMNHVRRPVQHLAQFQRSLGQEHKAVVVVQVPFALLLV